MEDKPIVRISDISKCYGDFTAVSKVSLDVFDGEVFALLGPNGAGKTTIIRMLMGTLQATGGSATIDGMSCFSDRADVMRMVGYMPDDPVFYDYLRGNEIIRFAGEMRGMTDEAVTAAAGALTSRLALDDDLNEYAANYSKGMKKKLAAVLAMMHNPRLLILDEPTNGLDPYATRTVHELIGERVSDGMSVFFSTHLLDQAERLCTRVGILHKGKLAAVGPLGELRAHMADDASLEEIFFAVTSDRPAAADRAAPADEADDA